MPLMKASHFDDLSHVKHVVLGPCPGCLLWTLEYTSEVAGSFCQLRADGTIDSRPFYLVIEHLLREHLDECVHLQMVLETL